MEFMPAWMIESRWMAVKCAVIIIFILLQAYLIFVNKHLVLDIDAYPNTRPSPNVFSDYTIGQTFFADRDYLSKIEVMLGTHERKNDKDVIFQLWEWAPEKNLVVQKKFNASTVQNNRYNAVEFTPQKQSKKKGYLFLFSSPESSPDNSICAWMNKEDIYRKGSFMLKGRSQEGDLVFRVYFKRSIAAELGRIVRHYSGIFGNELFLILALIFFTAVQLFVLSKLLDLTFKLM
jgi:hypothetical protein